MKGESLYKIATIMGNSPEICRRHYAALLPAIEGNRRVAALEWINNDQAAGVDVPAEVVSTLSKVPRPRPDVGRFTHHCQRQRVAL